MKRISTYLTSIVFTFLVSTAQSQSRLSISSFSNAALRVMIDGNRYNVMGNTFTISSLRPGFHTVKVYQQRRTQRGNGQGGNFPMSNFQLVYSSNLNLRSRFHADIVINRFGKAFYDESPLLNNFDEDTDWNDWDNNNWDNTNDNDGVFNGNRPMSQQSFDRFKETLRNEAFDNARMTIAKQVIADNWFTTAQIRQVMDFFSFENSKLDLAKYAFRYTVDKNEYYTLADAFSFSSNKTELMRFIQANR